VRETGKAVAIEPMASPDRKVIHDVLSTEDGVATRSQGEDPNRRVIVSPAD
jgi:spoIIIJ-associated protein